ncbi:hypothetical protein SH528x_003187 [Novipirellula sp. SH528]
MDDVFDSSKRDTKFTGIATELVWARWVGNRFVVREIFVIKNG